MRRSRPRRATGALDAVAQASAPRTRLGAVQAVWASAVGEGIAAAASPKSFAEDELTVACESATWAQELHLLQGKLLHALAERLGPPDLPKRIKFVCEPEPRALRSQRYS